MKQFFLSKIETIINQGLQLDPASNDRLKKLQGKIFAIEVLPAHIEFQCQFHSHGVSFQDDQTLEPIAKISGSPLQFFGAIAHKENRQQFFSDGITIQGDASAAQEAIALFDELALDWEKQTARFIGDAPAYYAGRTVKSIKNYFNNLTKELTLDITDYLQEEKLLLPTRLSVQLLLDDIDALRMDVDRMAQRVDLLKRYLNETNT